MLYGYMLHYQLALSISYTTFRASNRCSYW